MAVHSTMTNLGSLLKDLQSMAPLDSNMYPHRRIGPCREDFAGILSARLPLQVIGLQNSFRFVAGCSCREITVAAEDGEVFLQY